MKSVKRRIFEIIEIGNRDDIVSCAFDYFITVVIAVNLFILFLETFDYPQSLEGTVKAVEMITLIIFIAEYILRLWTSSFLYPQKTPAKALFSFIFSFYGLVDLFAILPYFLLMMPSGIAAFRVLRIIRVFRLFRINAQYDAFNVVLDVLNEKKSQLISSISLITMVMMCSSLLMYSIEHPLQPDVFKNALSGLWWSVSAIFTVGYGDIYPISTLGQIIAIIISFLGVMLVAIPTGIISAGFVEYFSRIKEMSAESGTGRMKFLKITIEEDHPWAGQMLKDMVLPPEITVAAVIRSEKVLIPRGKTVINPGDSMVLSSSEYDEGIKLLLRDETIYEKHPWAGRTLEEISLPDNMVVVSISRGEHVIAPQGSTMIMTGDVVTYCSNYAK